MKVEDAKKFTSFEFNLILVLERIAKVLEKALSEEPYHVTK